MLFIAAQPFILIIYTLLSVENGDWTLHTDPTWREEGRVKARTEMPSPARVGIGNESEVKAVFRWQLSFTGKR